MASTDIHRGLAYGLSLVSELLTGAMSEFRGARPSSKGMRPSARPRARSSARTLDRGVSNRRLLKQVAREIHAAVEVNAVSLVEQLLEAGADVNAKDSEVRARCSMQNP